MVPACNQLFSFGDSVREVRHSEIELCHTGMQPLERVRVVGWWELLACLLVVGPERDHEPVSFIDTRFHPRLKTRHGALGLSEPSSNLKLGLEYLKPGERHSGNDIARQQAQSELVRISKDPRVGDCQAERRGDLHGRIYRTFTF